MEARKLSHHVEFLSFTFFINETTMCLNFQGEGGGQQRDAKWGR